jgi:hypothetical protein
MPAVFREVSAAAGVDEGATPFPGMIVSVGGSNIARLAAGKFIGHRGGTRDLMQDGGSDTARIPFHDAIDFFNRP